MLTAPLEQFQILPIISLKIFGFDLSLTNFFLINIISIFIFVCIIIFNKKTVSFKSNDQDELIYSNSWQRFLEIILEVPCQLISDTINTDNNKYLPLISSIFNFILFSNLIGLIPYTFTTTSHIIVTFSFSFSIFLGITIITFQKYKMQAFSLFLPANSSFFLALILVPIEFISYIARPISLGMRLFINIMAGHSLLKVIIGFSWSMLLLENSISYASILPIIIVIILFGLEIGVALIQTYVFIILTCIYIQDGN